MYKVFNNIVPPILTYSVANSATVADYPEYNLPPLEVPNLDNPETTSIVSVNDIYDLFNAQRLGGFDNDIIQSIRSNILSSSPFADAISQLSDDEIMESIKPRNLQSPSQLMAWSKYIQTIIEERINVSRETPQPTDNQEVTELTSASESVSDKSV